MQEMLSAETIVKALKNFNKFYDLLEPIEQKNVLNALINKIEIYPRDLLDYNIRLKSIEFKIDMFKDTSISDDDGNLNMKNLKKFIKTKSNSIFKTVYFGDGEGQIPIEPINFERQTYVSPYTIKRIEENRKKPKSESDRIHIDCNKAIIAFVKDKYNLIVYGKFIRAVKTTLGIKYRKLEKDTINNDLYVPIEKWDAIVDALISLDMIPEELKDNINDIVKEKREEFINNKLNYTKRRRDNNSYIELRKKIKEETGYIVNCNNITEILDLITNYGTYIQKPLRTMPHHDRAKEILKYLIEYELVTDEDALVKFDKLYEVKKSKTLKKKRYNNDDIINYVKDKYKLTINGSMISYVRDKEGIKVKTKDRRFDPTQKNKRIPKQEQYDAIVETMKKFKMISTT